MEPKTNLFVALLPGLLALGFVAWLVWRWARSSDEPLVLIVRLLVTVIVLGYVMRSAALARDEAAKIVALIIGLIGGLIVTLIWRQKFCEFVGDQFASFYTGGSQEIDPQPLYSIAQARRKKGLYLEAIAEIRTQLAQFPTDFQGWMLLAEIQAEDLQDLAAARETLKEVLSQDGHAPKNIAYALNREADWHLKFAHSPEAARAALEQIVELLPDSEQAQQALQRIAHLPHAETLANRQDPQPVPVPHNDERIGLRTEPVTAATTNQDAGRAAAAYVRQLEAFPNDSEARENLALLYAREYRRLDLATDQLEQLITFPNQPPKQVVHWLNLLADLQLELAGDIGLARQSLQRIIEAYPKTAAAENALNRMAYLKLELRPKQQSQAVKLGSYEQNIGLKGEYRRP